MDATTPTTSLAPPKIPAPSRRAVVAWSVPTIIAMGAAPAYATSLRKDPGINGWVLVTTSDRERRTYDLRFDSDEPGTGPDGAPYGLYVYDVNVGPQGQVLDVLTNASITLWLRTDRDTTPATGWSRSGAGWSQASDVGLETKPDGLQYRGYRFTYSGAFTRQSDGRVYLSDLIASTGVNGSDATYWVERSITVNGTVQTFQRRNGDRGPQAGAMLMRGTSASAVTTATV